MQIVGGFDFEDFSDRMGITKAMVKALELAIKGSSCADRAEHDALLELSMNVSDRLEALQRDIDAETAREIKRAA